MIFPVTSYNTRVTPFSSPPCRPLPLSNPLYHSPFSSFSIRHAPFHTISFLPFIIVLFLLLVIFLPPHRLPIPPPLPLFPPILILPASQPECVELCAEERDRGIFPGSPLPVLPCPSLQLSLWCVPASAATPRHAAPRHPRAILMCLSHSSGISTRSPPFSLSTASSVILLVIASASTCKISTISSIPTVVCILLPYQPSAASFS